MALAVRNEAESIAAQTYNLTYRSCMAESGWRLRRECTKNCGK
jgi:hypothetical protein